MKIHLSSLFAFGIISLFFISFLTVSGYTNNIGVERNDVIDIQYEGRTQDNNVFDADRIRRAVVNPSVWIRGFYEGLLGMKVGQDKTITVQPEAGYTDPRDPLFNKILIFEVHLFEIANNVRDGASSSSGTFTTMWNVIMWIAGIGVFIFVVFTMNQYRVQNVSSMCVHCESLGRKTPAEGACGKCGTQYCRASFSRGCQNCKANSFVPKQ